MLYSYIATFAVHVVYKLECLFLSVILETSQVSNLIVSEMALRWGIVGTGKISNDFAAALKILPPGEHEIVAVAARNFDKAAEFAKNHNIPTAFEDYMNLAKDGSVVVVYVGVINTQHYNVSKMMLDHGKHVLCEKPLCMNEKQTTELIELAKSKKLFLMEGLWSRCFPAYTELRNQLNSGLIGEVLYCNVTFGIPMQGKERITSKELGGGGILDLGVYALQFIQFIFRGYKLETATAHGHLNENGVDEITNGILIYEEGRSAVVTCCTKALLSNEAVVIGTQGIIKVPTFWCPNQFVTPDKTFEFEVRKTALDLKSEGRPKGGLSYEAEEVRRCIMHGLIESPAMTHAESIELSQLMDKFLKDVGVSFPED